MSAAGDGRLACRVKNLGCDVAVAIIRRPCNSGRTEQVDHHFRRQLFQVVGGQLDDEPATGFPPTTVPASTRATSQSSSSSRATTSTARCRSTGPGPPGADASVAGYPRCSARPDLGCLTGCVPVVSFAS